MTKKTKNYIKNLELKEMALSKPGIGMTLIGSVMTCASNWTDPTGIIITMMGVCAVVKAQEYRNEILNILDIKEIDEKVKVKTKDIK